MINGSRLNSYAKDYWLYHESRSQEIFQTSGDYSRSYSLLLKPLDVEQWLIDIIDLLKAARITEKNQVEMAKIQLRDVART